MRPNSYIHSSTYTRIQRIASLCICKTPWTQLAVQRICTRGWRFVKLTLSCFSVDVDSFHYFRITALKAPHLESILSLVPPLRPSSLCMQRHFLLGRNAPNRSISFRFLLLFATVSTTSRRCGRFGWKSFVYAARVSTAIRFESIVTRAEAERFPGENGDSPKEARRN